MPPMPPILLARPDPLPPSPSLPRQLALPFALVAAPPPLPRLGPPVPPRRVWRSLGPPAQTAVRCAVVRIYQQVCQELRPEALEALEEVAHEHREHRAARG